MTVSLISSLADRLHLRVKYALVISRPSKGEELKGSLLVPFQWNSLLSSLSSPDMSHPYWQVHIVGLLENDILEMTTVYPLLVLHSTVTYRMTHMNSSSCNLTLAFACTAPSGILSFPPLLSKYSSTVAHIMCHCLELFMSGASQLPQSFPHTNHCLLLLVYTSMYMHYLSC